MYKWLYLLSVLLLFACNEETVPAPSEQPDLVKYIETNSNSPLVKDSLIACAMSGEAMFLNNTSAPLHILFYPEGNPSNFKYFETSSADVDPNDYENYSIKELPVIPIFNGYLRSFERETISDRRWGLVTYEREGKMYISNPIQLKFPDLPTEFNPALLQLEQNELLQPNFSWQDGKVDGNVIYFQVVMDADNNLLSGTYTFDRSFQFYDSSNVVLNIRATNPPPVLQANQTYTFVLMAVSIDNWVNLVIEQPFTT